MASLVVDDLRAGYISIRDWVTAEGKRVSPRGQQTTEILGAEITYTDPTNVLASGIGRKLATGLVALESCQLVGGFTAPALLRQVAERTFDYTEFGGVFHGAYGPRIRWKIPRLIERLQVDPDTRQARCTIWDDAYDLVEDGLRDYPCTTDLQGFIRDGRFILSVGMRSADVWWGIPYDVPSFAALQLSMARVLGVEAGPLMYSYRSLHVYDRDREALDALHEPHTEPIHLDGFGTGDGTWAGCVSRARDTVVRNDATYAPSFTAADKWFATQLAGLTPL